MVLDKDLRPLHQLTEVGEERYYDFLENKADEILFRSEHPLIWAYHEIRSWFNLD